MSSSLEGLSVSIDGTSIAFDQENGEYEIEITEADLIYLDLQSKTMRIKLHSNKIKPLYEDDMKIMNEMASSSLQNVDDEDSDDTDQEQEDDEEDEKNDDKKSDEIQHSEKFIPDDQQEIIQLSEEDENNENNDDEESKKDDHRYDDIVIEEEEEKNEENDRVIVEQNVYINYTNNISDDECIVNDKKQPVLIKNENKDNMQNGSYIEETKDEQKQQNIQEKTEKTAKTEKTEKKAIKQNIESIESIESIEKNTENIKTTDNTTYTLSFNNNNNKSHGSDNNDNNKNKNKIKQDGVDEYASSDEADNDIFDDNKNGNGHSIKIEHNLRDPYLDELLTKQINAALKIDDDNEAELNAEEYIDSNEEENFKNSIRNKNNWRWALKRENVATEWRKYAPSINLQSIHSMTKSLKSITTNSIVPNIPFVGRKQPCFLSIDQCDCVQRLIFLMKYYSFWMKFKTETTDNSYECDVNLLEYYECMTSLIISLKAYNRSKLLRDYLHIRHYHFNDDKLIAYIHRSQIPDCNDSHKMCKCITRNHQNKEIYKNVNKLQRRNLYWIESESMDDEKEEMKEIKEINLQKLLDVIHSSFLHNAISNGTKFVTSINIGQTPSNQYQQNTVRERRRRSALSSLSSLSSAVLSASSSQLNKTLIVDAPNYEFGIKFEFHDSRSCKFCPAKYADLKSELLNNTIHELTRNDFTSIYNKAQEYIQCDEGCKSMTTKRDILNFNIYKGTKISIQHIITILTRCNYSEIERKFNMNSWMKKNKKDNNKLILKEKNKEIANWNKYLLEVILCFGEILDDSQYIYHGINYKITFKDISGIQFNIPISCTTQYSVAKNFAAEHNDGICLKLGKMELTKGINYMFDISDFSDYPNEREVLIFGDKLTFVDIVYDSLSHHDYVLSLKLYQQIIRGRWFTRNNDYHNKKHQRRIVKMIENMMINNNNNNGGTNNYNDDDSKKNNNDDGMVKIDLDLGLNYIDPYIQSLFETITKNVLKKSIWINKESDTLLPELKTVFINDFIPFLKKKHDIKAKYAHVDTWIITKKHLSMTNRQHPLKSKPFDHVEILNNDDFDTTDNTDDENVENVENVTISNSDPNDPNKEKNELNEPMTLKQFKKLQKPTDLKIIFGFRCYKKYDSTKKQDMFKGEFYVLSLPKEIESVKMLGGLYFPQIPISKWDWCSFSNKKKSKGSSLFSMNQIGDDEQLKIKICYQVKEVNQKVSLP